VIYLTKDKIIILKGAFTMKKTGKCALAALLAILMALGTATAAAAAGLPQPAANLGAANAAARERQIEKGTARGVLSDGPVQQSIPAPGALRLKVKAGWTPGDYLLGFEKPDLSGLVIEVEMGDRKFDAKWDDRSGWFYDGNTEYYWRLFVVESEFPATPGAVNVPVHFYGEGYDYNSWQYTEYAGTVDVPMVALSLLSLWTANRGVLTADEPLPTTLLDEGAFTPNFYSFTPGISGFYALSASGTFAAGTRPFGVLLKASDGTILGNMSNDLKNQPLVFYLEAGVEYYYAVDYMYDKDPVAPGAFALTLLVAAYAPAALALNQSKQLPLGGQNERFNGIFSFTPTETRDYCFRSAADGIDLAADLLSTSMAVLASNDDGQTRFLTPWYSVWLDYGLDFKIVYRLEKDQTYFLSVRSIDGYFYNYGDNNSAVVWVEEAYLRGAAGTVTAIYEEYPPFYNMFSSNYDAVTISASDEYFNYGKVYMPTLVQFWYDYVAVKTGTTTVSAVVVDKPNVKAQATVSITYNWWQWLLVIFCFGWLWL